MTHVEFDYKGKENPSEAELYMYHLLIASRAGFSTSDNEIK